MRLIETDWPTDWLIDWLIDWLVMHCHSLIGTTYKCSTYVVPNLTDKYMDWLATYWLTEWLINGLIVQTIQTINRWIRHTHTFSTRPRRIRFSAGPHKTKLSASLSTVARRQGLLLWRLSPFFFFHGDLVVTPALLLLWSGIFSLSAVEKRLGLIWGAILKILFSETKIR